MAQNVTLSELRTQIADQLDVTVGASTRYTPTYFNQKINSSIRRFRERVSSDGMTQFLVSTTGTITAGATSPFSFKELDLSAVDPSVVRVFGVDITVSNIVRTLKHVPFQARNDMGGPTVTGIPEAWAMYKTRNAAIMPAPDQSYSYTVWYLPLLAALSADGDTFDAVDGWEQWIVWDVICQVIQRDQYQAAYAQAVQLRNEVWQDVIRGATKTTSAGGAVVGRDTLRGSRFMRRGDCGPVQGGTGLPPDGSVTNAMLVNMAEGTTKGRALGAGAGVPTDMTPGLTARNVAVYSGLAAGLVPTGNNGTSLFLREDATWAAPSVGGSVSGLTLSQLQNIPEPRLLGRFSLGTGAVEALTPSQVATLMSYFGSGIKGVVAGPTGADGTKFLRDDNTWNTPAGGVSSGIANSQLIPFPPLTVLGNPNVASGTADYLTRGQVASMMPLFGSSSGATRGFVYAPTAGVTGRFLRDDGSFQGTPSFAPTGIGLGQLAAIPETTVLGRTSPSGIPEALAPSAVATMMPLFNTAHKGLVPAPGVVSGNFLKDDGTWASTAGGSATGISNSMILPMPPFSLKGRNDIASGIPQDILIPAVASMLPNHFGGSGTTRGLVYAPTAGVANRFLRDDGSFQGVPSFIPTGLALTQFAAIPETTILGRTSPSGIPEALTPSAVATMMPLFNPIDKGLVPGSAGGTTTFLRADGAWATPAGGAGGGPTMLAAGSLGAVQYNGGSGFAGATGFRFGASSGIHSEHVLNMPTGTIRLGPLPSTNGLFRLPNNPGVVAGYRAYDGTDRQLLGLSGDGSTFDDARFGDSSASGGSFTTYLGAKGQVAVQIAEEVKLTVNSSDVLVGSGMALRWETGGAGRISVGGTTAISVPGANQVLLGAGQRLGVPQFTHSATTDKLGSWTASGFANIATGIFVGASGYLLGIGSGGPQLTASGIDMRASDMQNVRRINQLDGIKVYGFIPGGGAASGTQEIVSASGTAFIVPETTTTGQVYAMIPTLAMHGDTVLLENRTGLSHMVNNAGTGMGTPSGFIATLAPSMGMSVRFASGAWEYGNRYQLGGY